MDQNAGQCRSKTMKNSYSRNKLEVAEDSRCFKITEIRNDDTRHALCIQRTLLTKSFNDDSGGLDMFRESYRLRLYHTQCTACKTRMIRIER